MRTGVIFDLDGTILDSMCIWDDVGEIFLQSLGIEAEADLKDTLFCLSITEGAELLKHSYHLDMDVESIILAINETIADFYYRKVELKEGAELLLKALHRSGIKMVVATSCDRQVAERSLERLNVLHYFDRIFTCTEIGAGKVQPDIYLTAAEYLGTLPQDTWVFEDALHAIQTAKAAGFKTVGVFDPSSQKDSEEIRQISYIYLEKMGDINDWLKKLP